MPQYQITLKYSQENNATRNVLVYNQSAGDGVSWPDVLQEFAVAWAGGLAASYSPGTLFQGIDVLRLDPGFVTQSFNLAAPGLPGTGEDGPGATQIASLVTLIGELPLKPNRGRIYLPSPNRLQFDANAFFLTVHLNRVTAWMEAIKQINDTEGALLDLVIWSRVFPEKAAVQFNPVSGWIVKSNPATQRKRRIGVGS